MTARHYINPSDLEDLDTERSLACTAIRSWWDDNKEGRSYPEGDEITLELVNSYQSKLCTFLGITVQQETGLSLDLGLLIIKEPIMGGGGEGARVTLNYCYPSTYVPYKVWVAKGRTTLGFEAYSTGDLIGRTHNAYCVVEMFGEGRPQVW